jgi:hypothetical protein
MIRICDEMTDSYFVLICSRTCLFSVDEHKLKLLHDAYFFIAQGRMKNLSLYIVLIYLKIYHFSVFPRGFARASDRGRIGVFYAFKMPKTHWR